MPEPKVAVFVGPGPETIRDRVDMPVRVVREIELAPVACSNSGDTDRRIRRIGIRIRDIVAETILDARRIQHVAASLQGIGRARTLRLLLELGFVELRHPVEPVPCTVRCRGDEALPGVIVDRRQAGHDRQIRGDPAIRTTSGGQRHRRVGE